MISFPDPFQGTDHLIRDQVMSQFQPDRSSGGKQARGLVIGTLFLWLSLPAPLFAQRVVTLDEAYRSATRSEQIRIAFENVVQAEEEKERAKSFLYPRLTADLSYLRRPNERSSEFGVLLPESQTQINITLEQPLYTGGRASATYRINKKEVEGRNLDLNLTKEALFFNVALAYYDALKAQKNVFIEESDVKRLEEHRRNSEKRFRVGESTKAVLLRAEAELSEARARLVRAQNNHVTAKDRLGLLAKIEGSFELGEPPSITLSEKSEDEWIETARANRFDLQRRAINIDTTKEGIEFAEGAFYPTLSLEGQLSRTNQDPESTFIVENDRRALLKLNFPIFEGGLRRAELAQARSRHRQSLLANELLKDEVAIDVRRAMLNLSALTAELEHLKHRVAFARENFSLASRQFAVGLGTNIDVLDANATLIDAERQLSNTTYDREIAILQLERTVGIFLRLAPQGGGETAPSEAGPTPGESGASPSVSPNGER